MVDLDNTIQSLHMAFLSNPNRMLSLEHGIEEAAEQLSSVLTWRERFDVASGQMAAVLEMLQTDTEAMR